MLFNSIHFLFFFAVVFLLYYTLPFPLQKYMLFFASCYFYMCWKAEFIILIAFSIFLNYVCSLGIEKFRTDQRIKKILLYTSIIINLGLLFFFKYWNFFGESLTTVFQTIAIPFSVPMLEIILPVGISFYTFQTMSYTIDVYRGEQKAEKNFLDFALFVSFFPQLVAGPIERASNLLPQLKSRHTFSYTTVTYGLKLMAWGFFKKLVIADRLSMLFVDPVYQNVTAHTGGALVGATVAFAIQIYCDFSGYSDIARGCAKTMGIDLMVNFKAPYLAKSMTDFWRRWHISLTSWFREYVYIPLGGNRKGKAKKLLFVTVTFFLSGLWHGAAWTFVIWGLLQGLYLNTESLLGISTKTNSCADTTSSRAFRVVKNFAARFMTFALCCFSWVFFRANTTADALYIIRHALTGISTPLSYCKQAFSALFPGEILLFVSILTVFVLFLFDFINEHKDPIEMISSWSMPVRWSFYICFLLILVLLIPKENTAPFIYFQF